MHVDLIIIGGGLAGLSLAAALRRSGRRIALIEARPLPAHAGADPRAYALNPTAVDFLDASGVWSHLDSAHHCAITEMHIVGDAGGTLSFSAYDACVPCLACMVEAGALSTELWQTVKRQANVSLITGKQPQSLQASDQDVSLTLSGGKVLTAELVVGADGRDSWTRRACALPAQEHPYDELGVVATFRCARPHAGQAFQFFGQSGVLAWLPLGEDRVSIVWSAPTAIAQGLMALPPEQLAGRVAQAGAHRLGEFTALGPAAGFPLRLITVPDTVADRVALIGDAAHGIHPLSGHGINLGFADAKALAGIIDQASPHADLGEAPVLRRYQRARLEETAALQRGTDALHQLFSHGSPLIGALRNQGMTLVDRLPILKTALARYAMG
jgi:ubiquinone biosynthesis UbiH/UbiF/VisC/COQ6 family hydroxylase